MEQAVIHGLEHVLGMGEEALVALAQRMQPHIKTIVKNEIASAFDAMTSLLRAKLVAIPDDGQHKLQRLELEVSMDVVEVIKTTIV